MDKNDPLRSFRQMFMFPKKSHLPNSKLLILKSYDRERKSEKIDKTLLKDPDEECIYLCGQSLGLKPKSMDQNVQKVLDNWSKKGVHSHFHGYLPAALSDLPAKKLMSRMVGAQEHEIAILNGLTVNLHLLLATFYRPDSNRYKLMIEDHAFPSDMYVAKSQLRSHGISPEKGLILLKPRKGENLLNENDIIRLFDEQGDQIKVALLPAVQYYTGQLLNVKRLTEAAHKKGIIVGVDLAHAVGNVPIYLDEWNVDFAAWCTYKYMNAGAGSMGAIYVNEKYFANYSETFPMYQGWWGNNVQTKFLMKGDFDPALGADMFKLSNPSPVLNAMLMTSLEIFEQTSMEELRQKEYLLTGYLEFMIKSFFPQTNNQQRQSSDND
ncbi:kynureninase-like protein, partial [Euroglyphus maynei]